jgi:uncharacterized membrane protein YkoI
MRKSVRSNSLGVLLTVFASVNAATCSGEERPRHDDHDVARAALERGEILPLDTILARVRLTLRGDVVDVELRQESGAWVYAIKVIAAENALIELAVDARTATVLKKAR